MSSFLLPGALAAEPQAPLEGNDSEPPPTGYVPPKLVGEVHAVYPKEAFDNNVEASVGLLLYIDAEGKVVHCDVDVPAVDSRFDFDKNAAAAFEAATFEPALVDGRPRAVKVRVTYEYKIVFKEPVLKNLVQAAYPEKALREGITDSVLAELAVNEAGEVTAVTLTKSARHPGYGFDRAALVALKQFEFEPARKNGVAVPVTVTYRYDFVLPKAWVPPSERPVNLKIELRERGTRKPLAGGFISLKKGDAPPVEASFQNGIYEGRGLAAGDWEVVVQAEGYQTVETRVTVIEGKVVTASYLVERMTYDVLDQSDDATATGEYVYETREPEIEREVSVQTLQPAEIQRVPGNNGDTVKVVQNLPGVSRSSYNTGAVIIRGSAPADSAVLLDGTPIPLIYHFGGLSSTVNSDALDDIKFVPGNFSVRYGRAMGGVVDARTRAPSTERYTGYFDLDIVDGSLFLEGPIYKNLSFMASVRRSWIDGILAALPDDAMVIAPRYWDYQGKLHWFTGQRDHGRHELELMFYGSDDLMELLQDSETIKVSTAFHHAKLKWEFESTKLENALLYDFGWNSALRRAGTEREEKVVFEHNIRDDLTVHLSKWVDIITGFDVRVEQYRVDVDAPARKLDDFLRGEWPENTFYEVITVNEEEENPENEQAIQKERGTRAMPAAFLAFGLRPVDALYFTVGSRLDYDSLSNDWAVDLRGSGRFQAHRYISLKGGVGTFHQPPLEKELSKTFGNPDLEFQDAVHFSFGGEGRLPVYEALSLDVTGFYKILKDLVAASDAMVERDGVSVAENYHNRGQGRVYGAEIMLRHRPANNFFGWVSYTLSRSERNDRDGELWYRFDYDQTHILTVLGSYKLPKGFTVGLRFRYVTGTPFTPLHKGAFNADWGVYEPIEGKRNSERLDAYHQLDLRIDKDWVFDYWMLTAYLDIQNVYYHANAEMAVEPYDYGKAVALTGLPILPSFGIRGAF